MGQSSMIELNVKGEKEGLDESRITARKIG